MSIRAAKLYVEIGAETKGAEDGMARVDKGVKQLATVGTGAMKALGTAVVGAGAGFLALGGQALGVYSDFERMGMSLQQLAAKEKLSTGEARNMEEALAMTASTAQELQQWVQKLAIESPFTSQGVADAFKMSMAYGFTADEAKRLTEAMIDFAAGSGASEFTMQKIALALGQIQAKGKLAGGEVLQLTEAGLNVNEILADAFGKSTAEIVALREDGLIPADAAIEAIIQNLETNFAGAAQRQSGTIAGLVSSLEDLQQISMKEFFGPLFREYQPDLNKFVQTLQDPATVANIREMGEEFAGFTREVLNSGGAVVGWFRELEDSTQAALIGMGLLSLNAGTVVKVVGGLGLVLSGATQAIATSIAAWNAGLSMTTALQAGLGVMPVTIGAIGLAVAAVAGMWIAWNENIEKTNRLGNEGVKSTWGDFFGELRGEGASARQITDEFTSALGRMNEKISDAGVAGLFVDRGKLIKNSLAELSDELAATSGSYDEYRALMMEAAEASGILENYQYRAILNSGDQARVEQYLAETLGLKTEAELQAARALALKNGATREAVEGTLDYEKAEQRAWMETGKLTNAYRENLKQAQEVAEAKAQMAKLEEELTEATRNLAQAEGEWMQQAGGDIVSQLEQAGIRGEDYRDALSAIDEIYGTTYGLQHDYMEDVKELVAEYKKTGDIDAFKRKMGELKDTYMPFKDSVAAARLEMNRLKREYDTLVSKIIYIDVVKKDGGGGGYDPTPEPPREPVSAMPGRFSTGSPLALGSGAALLGGGADGMIGAAMNGKLMGVLMMLAQKLGQRGAGDLTINIYEARDARDTAHQVAFVLENYKR